MKRALSALETRRALLQPRQHALPRVLAAERRAHQGVHIVMRNAVAEFELPFEGGRRPDIVVLAGSAVIVLEFKDEPRIVGTLAPRETRTTNPVRGGSVFSWCLPSIW